MNIPEIIYIPSLNGTVTGPSLLAYLVEDVFEHHRFHILLQTENCGQICQRRHWSCASCKGAHRVHVECQTAITRKASWFYNQWADISRNKLYILSVDGVPLFCYLAEKSRFS